MSATPPIPQDPEVCAICDEDKQEGEPAIIYMGDDICLDCLILLITRVVEDKDQYPVKLARKVVLDYADHLDATLLEQYKLKGIEHSTFPDERVFCSCGKFIGRLIVHREGEEYIAVKTCPDTTCQRFSCLNCAAKLEDIAAIIDHGCNETRQAKEEDKQKMLESNERGTKFQLCPNCSRPIQLTEACHHIKCPCGTEFCYLCGKAASERSGHWRQGRCPRYPAQPARLPPARPLTEQDHRDIANGIRPMLDDFNGRLAHMAGARHDGFNINQVRAVTQALYDATTNNFEIRRPPRRPEPETPLPPARPDIPRDVSPPAHPGLRFRPMASAALHPIEPFRPLQGEEGNLNEAPGAMNAAIDAFLPRQRQELRERWGQAFRGGRAFQQHILGIFDGDLVDTTRPTTRTEREAFDNGRRHELRSHGLRSRSPSPQQNPAEEQTDNAADERDPDPMETPSPPRTPMFPPGHAPQFPPFSGLPPTGGNFVPHSAVFHPAHLPSHSVFPPMPPSAFASPPPHPLFPHPPRTIPHPSAPRPPFGGVALRPPMSTTRPQAPVEREAEDPFARPHWAPPSPQWNDNDNA